MVVDGRIESNGVEAPAVTVCGRSPQFSRGWRGNVTVNCGIVELMCGDAEDIEGCIETKTFNRSEMVKDVLMGYMTRKSLVNENNPWIEDFTRSRRGRCHTLNIPQRIGPNGNEERLFLLLSHDLVYQIFIHDPDYFVMNSNPVGLPTIMKKLNPNTSTSHYYRLSVTNMEELNVPDDPCNPDSSYNFQSCVRQSISSKVGCKTKWDRWSNEEASLPRCSTLDQFR